MRCVLVAELAAVVIVILRRSWISILRRSCCAIHRRSFRITDSNHPKVASLALLPTVVALRSQRCLMIMFLSDPGPIIVYACQALTDSLTDDFVEDLMN